MRSKTKLAIGSLLAIGTLALTPAQSFAGERNLIGSFSFARSGIVIQVGNLHGAFSSYVDSHRKHRDTHVWHNHHGKRQVLRLSNKRDHLSNRAVQALTYGNIERAHRLFHEATQVEKRLDKLASLSHQHKRQHHRRHRNRR